jgi:hypothetical protein
VKGFDYPGDNMPNELNAVFYNPAFAHISMVPKLVRYPDFATASCR